MSEKSKTSVPSKSTGASGSCCGSRPKKTSEPTTNVKKPAGNLPKR